MDAMTDLRKQGYDWDNISRVFRVILDDLTEIHPEWRSEAHQDLLTSVPDCPCGHMNEAEYVLSVIDSHIDTGAYRILAHLRTRYPQADMDWIRHEVVMLDDGTIPICDVCDGPQRVEGDDWNGETGNHYSCEKAYPSFWRGRIARSDQSG